MGRQRRLNKGVTILRRQKKPREDGQANGVAFVILNRAQFLIFFARAPLGPLSLTRIVAFLHGLRERVPRSFRATNATIYIRITTI